jgi:hypothetical protein
VRRIGVLMPQDENDPLAKSEVSAFTQALVGLCWTEGRNVRMDLRSGGADINRIRAIAQELVGLQPEIILASGTAAAIALQQRTQTIPIVFANVGDPVAQRIVARLNQPGGNITGFGTNEASLGGKWLELLSEIAPGLKRAAFMFNPDIIPVSTFMSSFETAARSLKVAPIIAPVHSDVEIETAIIALGREPGGGLVVTRDVFSSCIARRSYRRPPETTYRRSITDLTLSETRLALLRNRPGRHLSWCRHLCRSHPARREAGRSPGAVSDKIRDGREPQNRHGARPCHTPIDSAACL